MYTADAFHPGELGEVIQLGEAPTGTKGTTGKSVHQYSYSTDRIVINTPEDHNWVNLWSNVRTVQMSLYSQSDLLH